MRPKNVTSNSNKTNSLPSPGGYCIALYVNDGDSFVLCYGTLMSSDRHSDQLQLKFFHVLKYFIEYRYL